MTENPILIVAANARGFRDYIWDLATLDENFKLAISITVPRARIGEQHYFYISHWRDLVGLDSRCRIKFLPSSVDRRDYDEICKHAEAKGFKVE